MRNTNIPVPASRPDGPPSSGTTTAASTVSYSLSCLLHYFKNIHD